MSYSNWSKTEAANRILRRLQGEDIDTTDEVTGEFYSFEECLARITKLLSGELLGQTFTPPGIASVTEANEGTSNTVLLTPAGHSWAHEYGGIYVSTGTSEISLAANTWTKVTGTFKNYMLDSGSEISCDWNDDRIVVNEVGTYLVQYQFSLLCRGDSATIQFQTYVNGTAQPQTRSAITYGASGTVDGSKSVSSMGYVSVVSGTYAVDVRTSASVATIIEVTAGQLVVQKMVG
jgi:hypothetical protein